MSSVASVPMPRATDTRILWCVLAIIAALVLGVGPVSGTVLHHIVQTLPLWAALAVRRRPLAAWFLLPCFIFWLAIMAAIWAFLLHLPSFVNGHFSPVEI